MTNVLKNTYGFTTEDIIPKDYDYQKGGHGKVLVKAL